MSTTPISGPPASFAPLPTSTHSDPVAFARQWVTRVLVDGNKLSNPELVQALQEMDAAMADEKAMAEIDEAVLQAFLTTQRTAQSILTSRRRGEDVKTFETPRSFGTVGCDPGVVLSEKGSGTEEVFRLVPGADGLVPGQKG